MRKISIITPWSRKNLEILIGKPNESGYWRFKKLQKKDRYKYGAILYQGLITRARHPSIPQSFVPRKPVEAIRGSTKKIASSTR